MRRNLAIFVGVLLLLSIRQAPVLAQKSGYALSVNPAYVEVELNHPDDVKEIVLTFTNSSDKTVDLNMFPIDFKQQDENGMIGFIGQSAGSYSYSLSSFLSFESNKISVDPHSKQKFTISVKNRQDLSPGGHYAAVVAKMEEDSQTGAVLAPSVSSLILLRKVGGERFNLSLSDVNWPTGTVVFGYPESVRLLFQNEGNVHLIPYGTVQIKDLSGRLLYKGIINVSSARVFPESRRYIPVDLKRVSFSAPVSIDVMTVEGRDSLNKTKFVSRETFLYVNQYSGIIILIFPVLFIAQRRKKR